MDQIDKLKFSMGDLTEFVNMQVKEHHSPIGRVSEEEVTKALKLLSAQGLGVEYSG